MLLETWVHLRMNGRGYAILHYYQIPAGSNSSGTFNQEYDCRNKEKFGSSYSLLRPFHVSVNIQC